MYDVTSDLDEALIGVQAIVYVSLKEDALQVEHLLNVFNVGPVTWVPKDVTMTLPEGFKAYTKPEESMDDTRADEISGKGAALRGTYKPGQASVTFRYQVPLSGEEKQSLRIEMPPHVAQVRVMAEASKTMGLEVTGFPGSQKGQNREGKRLLVTEKQVQRSEGGVKVLDIRVSGLPTKGPGPWVAVALGAAALTAPAVYVAQRQSDGLMPNDARADLGEARDALLEEIVALEKAHAAGEVGPKAYARIRLALVDALARIVRRLETPSAAKPTQAGAYRSPSW